MHRLVIKKLEPRFVTTKRLHRLQATSWEYALGRREIYSMAISDLETHDLAPQQLYPHPVAIDAECRQHVQENDDIADLSRIIDDAKILS